MAEIRISISPVDMVFLPRCKCNAWSAGTSAWMAGTNSPGMLHVADLSPHRAKCPFCARPLASN